MTMESGRHFLIMRPPPLRVQETKSKGVGVILEMDTIDGFKERITMITFRTLCLNRNKLRGAGFAPYPESNYKQD